MAEYQMSLKLGNKTLRFPVLPEKIQVKSPGKNESATVLELGEINIIRKKGLREISWSCFFPAHDAPYVSARNLSAPIDYIEDIQEFRNKRKQAQFYIYGTDLDINIPVSIDTFDYEERAGEVGDIYYNITLREWKKYKARGVVLQAAAAPTVQKANASARSGEPPAAKTHTVVKGDSMWAIAQKYYGDGSKYPDLYAKNKTTIDAKNKGTGNPKYTIYPGQVLIL